MKCRAHKGGSVLNYADISVHITLWKFMTSDIDPTCRSSCREDDYVYFISTFHVEAYKRI
jgi:hypothetical protein